HSDPRQGFHPDWKSAIFNYGPHEVRSFLLSSALFWLDKYHIDGLRVDAVASMLYLDYSREEGEWVPNHFGGRENLEAISLFLRLLYGYQWTQPGKKLLFMGGEFGQGREWNHDDSIDWHLLEVGWHRGILNWVRDLNRVYRTERALHEGDTTPGGFEWIDCNDA